MRTADALPLLKNVVGKPFGELFKDLPDDVRTNKGKIGQALLMKIGVGLDSNLMDFDDGELKTNKADANGNPMETMFITQILRNVDSYLGPNPLPFSQTDLYKKINNLVFLPVCKTPINKDDWFFVDCHNIDLSKHGTLKEQLRRDYIAITNKMRNDVENGDGKIHTSSGRFLQIRTKDSKPYNAIFSRHYNKYVSNKNYAFYFKKDFMRYCREHL